MMMKTATPLLSVFGGITTYRKLAEHAMEKLASLSGHRPGMDKTCVLRRHDIDGNREDYAAAHRRCHF